MRFRRVLSLLGVIFAAVALCAAAVSPTAAATSTTSRSLSPTSAQGIGVGTWVDGFRTLYQCPANGCNQGQAYPGNDLADVCTWQGWDLVYNRANGHTGFIARSNLGNGAPPFQSGLQQRRAQGRRLRQRCDPSVPQRCVQRGPGVRRKRHRRYLPHQHRLGNLGLGPQSRQWPRGFHQHDTLHPPLGGHHPPLLEPRRMLQRLQPRVPLSLRKGAGLFAAGHPTVTATAVRMVGSPAARSPAPCDKAPAAPRPRPPRQGP